LYGVEATDGNVYYFTSMPSLTNTKLQSWKKYLVLNL
jgi:hypothetical protein